LQPATPLAEHEATRLIPTQEKIVDMVQGTKTSSTQKGKASPKNLDSSFLSIDEQGNIVPKTPEAALVAA
jgi:hypothetical protein